MGVVCENSADCGGTHHMESVVFINPADSGLRVIESEGHRFGSGRGESHTREVVPLSVVNIVDHEDVPTKISEADSVVAIQRRSRPQVPIRGRYIVKIDHQFTIGHS